MNRDFKAIIFDLGNVTVSFNHNFAVDRVKYFTNRDHNEIYQLFFESNLTRLFEEGKISPDEFYLKVSEQLSLNMAYEEFLIIWNEIFFVTEDNLRVHFLIEKLKQKFMLILISNINILHYEYLKKKYDIFTKFDKQLLSYRLGLRKPDPLIYKRALLLTGTEKSGVIYIDDREDLIAAASKLGIKSIRFKNYSQLRRDLMDLGLKIFSEEKHTF